MTTTQRLSAIQAGIAQGLSRRAIARSLGISEKLVRTILRSAEPSPAAAEYPDYIAPGPERVLPPLVVEGGVALLPISPTKVFIRCTCGHPAWRTAPGVDAWECGCPPKHCHGPRQVPDEHGTPQLVWGPFVIRPFGLPAEAT